MDLRPFLLALMIAFAPAALLRVTAQAPAADAGEAVYQANCASCHDSGGDRIPTRDALQRVSSENILRELTSGTMAPMATGLSEAQRLAVATFLGVAPTAVSTENYCADRTVAIPGSIDPDTQTQWNGWSPSPTNSRFQTAARAGLSVDQVAGLRLKWAWGFEGDQIVFSIPNIIGGNVFVGSNSGRVHALDLATGCTRWVFQADSGVRSATSLVRLENGEHAILFGDRSGQYYSIEATTGNQLWKVTVDEHEGARLTGSALIHDGIAYLPISSIEETLARREGYQCCTFRGSVVAVRVADGEQLWRTYMIDQTPHMLTPIDASPDSPTGEQEGEMGPSGAAIWSTPTLDLRRNRIYVTTGDNYSDPATSRSDAVVALDLPTGEILWARQAIQGDVFNGRCQPQGTCPGPDYDYGSSVILATVPDANRPEGRDVLLAGQKSGIVYALDPDANGAILWETRVGEGGVNGGIQWGMAADGQNVYAANSDVLRRPGATYDPEQGGGLTALRIADGTQVWHADPEPCDDKPGCSPAQSSAVTVIPGIVFSGSLDGHLRAYSSETGAVVWDFDTARSFETVNHVEASGGGIDGPGPVVANGMVLVGSGYERTGGMGGNVLLAFEAGE